MFMNTKADRSDRIACQGLNSLAVFLILLGAGSNLIGQQYCASGAITSVLNCNSCNFNIGDPVAMTFTVVPGSVGCPNTSGCIADLNLSAKIGDRYWTGPV